MKHIKWLGLWVICLLFGCQAQTEKVNISKASILQLPFTETETEVVTFIYHYNSQRSNLEWTAVKLAMSSGNELKDALIALLADFRKNKICQGFQLADLTMEKNQPLIQLSGNPIFKSKQDRTIFWSALELTINRYTKSKGYKLALDNDKESKHFSTKF